MLFKKRSAPSFQTPPGQTQPNIRQPIPSQTNLQGPSLPKPPHQRPATAPISVSKEQLEELQSFMQLSYQTVADYELLIQQMPTQHVASILTDTIEEEKHHYQMMLQLYTALSNKEPTITEAIVYRNGYIPALKKAFEQEQKAAASFENAARSSTVPQLGNLYASIARDQQRHALWLLSYLTIYRDNKNEKS
ncbi:ferritin-like domain-containing protein [Bacillus sp. JCM 19041]|uniref:ferritin-like domain-containing protein n=1 Tax=Bacillus sp. JCM 19041 TaxID=1460637 RepID=UPI0006D2A178